MRNKLNDFDFKLENIPIFCDNTSTIVITENPAQHSRSKHIDIRYHFIREHVMNGTVELYFVPSEKKLTDIFTKPLDESTFSRLVSELGVIPKDLTISCRKWGFEYNLYFSFKVRFYQSIKFIQNCKQENQINK